MMLRLVYSVFENNRAFEIERYVEAGKNNEYYY